MRFFTAPLLFVIGLFSYNVQSKGSDLATLCQSSGHGSWNGTKCTCNDGYVLISPSTCVAATTTTA